MALIYNQEGCTMEFDDARRRATIRGPLPPIAFLVALYEREGFMIDDWDVRTSTVMAVLYPPESEAYKLRIRDRFYEHLLRFANLKKHAGLPQGLLGMSGLKGCP